MRILLASVSVVASLAFGLSVEGQSPAAPPRDVLFNCPDPAVIQPRESGPVYAFSTGLGVPVFRSDDLYHWTRVDRVFPRGAPSWAAATIPGARGIWAPDIRRFNGRYWLYYAVSTFGSQHSAIGLATNASLDPAAPDYRWVDRGPVLESDRGKTDFNAIDPAMIVDRDRRPFLFWGSYWSGIKAAPLDGETGKLPPDATITAVAARAQGVDPPAIEGAYVLEHGGYWYLFVSWDSCCDRERSTYKIMVGRSKSLLGPYLDDRNRPMAAGGGTLVLASYGKWRGPGHISALSTAHGDWLVLAGYHADHIRRGRVLQVRRMYWPEDGWPVVGEPIHQPEKLDGRMAPAESGLDGRWRQWIDYAAESTLEFRADGSVVSDQKTGTWNRQNATLMLTWPGEGQSGTKTERVKLTIDGDYCVGRDAAERVVFLLRDH